MSIRTFRIVLDGVAHEVEVEELNGAKRQAAPAASPTPQAAAPVASAPTQAAPAPAAAGAVQAPLQGTILSVDVSAGQAVKAGDVLVIIEAMKMENEIVAPGGGTVASVAVQKGDTVNAGDLLLTLR